MKKLYEKINADGKKRPGPCFKVGNALVRKREYEEMRKRQLGGIGHSHGIQWFRGQQLGRGGFGTVYVARSKIPEDQLDPVFYNLPYQFAVKSVEKSKSASLEYEKKILCDLRCGTHVIQCFGDEITRSPDGKTFYYNILLEYCSGPNLHDRILQSGCRGLPHHEVQGYTRDIVSGLRDIHAGGYVHCDIRPANILLEPDEIWLYNAKIADFGLAKKQTDGKSSTLRGTYRYMSPELVRDGVQRPPSDIWALGCTVAEMISGKSVWTRSLFNSSSDNTEHLLERIAYAPELIDIPTNVSQDVIDFLDKCLAPNPDCRWSAEQLWRHPFICIDVGDD